MIEKFTVWLIKTESGFLKCPWNPQPPMIFSNELSAKCHLEAMEKEGEVVKGEMIFREVVEI